jgi:hypothetical protein
MAVTSFYLKELCPNGEDLAGGHGVETGDKDVGVQPDGQPDESHPPAVYFQGGQRAEGGRVGEGSVGGVGVIAGSILAVLNKSLYSVLYM